MKVIAISGWKGSGKDTVAGYMINNYGAVRTAFADPLKDMTAAEYGIPREYMDDPSKKESPIISGHGFNKTMMVNPQDAYSKMIAEFMIKEFKDLDGNKMKSFKYIDRFYGVPETGTYKDSVTNAFWTPRALCILKGSTNRSVDTQYWVQRALLEITRKEAALNVITDLRYKSEVEQLKQKFGADLTVVRINRFETSPSSDPSERDLDNYSFDSYIDNTQTLDYTYAQVGDLVRKL